jgi:hypothetical protein
VSGDDGRKRRKRHSDNGAEAPQSHRAGECRGHASPPCGPASALSKRGSSLVVDPASSGETPALRWALR